MCQCVSIVAIDSPHGMPYLHETKWPNNLVLDSNVRHWVANLMAHATHTVVACTQQWRVLVVDMPRDLPQRDVTPSDTWHWLDMANGGSALLIW